METEENKETEENSNSYTEYIVIGIIALIMFFTNPSLNKHRSELISSLKEELQTKFYQKNLNQTIDIEGFNIVMTAALERETYKYLSINNYFLWSSSEYLTSTGTETVSYGLFGHVFITKTFDEIKPAVVQE